MQSCSSHIQAVFRRFSGGKNSLPVLYLLILSCRWSDAVSNLGSCLNWSWISQRISICKLCLLTSLKCFCIQLKFRSSFCTSRFFSKLETAMGSHLSLFMCIFFMKNYMLKFNHDWTKKSVLVQHWLISGSLGTCLTWCQECYSFVSLWHRINFRGTEKFRLMTKLSEI